MIEQTIVFGTLSLALILFVAGKWRYDIVALLALLIVTLTGIVSWRDAFMGFGHPAVVTVAAVLVLSRGLHNSGVVDTMVRWLSYVENSLTIQIAALTGLVATLSAFMNNVGAAALLIPVAIRMARKNGHSPSLFLMPLAFGSLLGGMTTLIGTPPNIIISAFREREIGEPFSMFEFTPVGIGVAAAGLLYISLIGWRLLPKRKGAVSKEELFRIEDYTTELRVAEGSKLVGKSLRDIEAETEATIVGFIRGEEQYLAPPSLITLRTDDVIIVRADSEALKKLVDAGIKLAGSKEREERVLKSDKISVLEAVVKPNALIEGRTASSLNLHWVYGVSLLAISRQGERLTERLGRIRFKAGDVLLLQGEEEALQKMLSILGCLPLAERGLRIGQPRRVLLSVGIFGSAIGAISMGMLPASIALVGAAVIMVLMGILSLREAYESIDWSVVVLLGAMIPVGQALESTGGAQTIAAGMLEITGQISPAAALIAVLVASMILTPMLNNASAAVLMAPIAISVARGVGASADPFLIAVAIGASCDFLTPIGHQSNTIVWGPGGYRFSDYPRMGLPLEIIVVAVAIPLILWFWPLGLSSP